MDEEVPLYKFFYKNKQFGELSGDAEQKIQSMIDAAQYLSLYYHPEYFFIWTVDIVKQQQNNILEKKQITLFTSKPNPTICDAATLEKIK